MTAYYNEIDPHAAAWLRELIKAGHIAPGDVDERSITDVQPDDLRGYTQCHFFAGIGGWSYALRLAGWPDDRPVWTGSCPCQPFSTAGKQRGSEDERHLWPAFFRLIRESRPATVFGEQVAGAAGLAWLDHVCADLEDAGYAAAAANLCAAGVGAPHIRQRLYWLADAGHEQQGRPAASGEAQGWRALRDASRRSVGSGLADSSGERRQQERRGPFGDEAADGRAGWNWGQSHCDNFSGGDGEGSGLGDTDRQGSQEQPRGRQQPSGPTSSIWDRCEWLPCLDGKARPVEPGTSPLAHGIPARVVRLRGYGNAIVPQVAAAFIRAAA